MSQIQIGAADLATISRTWQERWFSTLTVTTRREYTPEDVEGLVLRTPKGDIGALVTWYQDGAEAEIVTLDALIPGHRYGMQLMAEAERRLFDRGAERLVLDTTNDNVSAIRGYLLAGWRVVSIHLDYMDETRARKPGVPTIGENDLPLRDHWELEKLARDAEPPMIGETVEPMDRFRERIDAINQQIIRSMVDRFAVVRRVGEHKRETGGSVTDSAREEAVAQAMESAAVAKGLPGGFGADLARLIIDYSKRDEERVVQGK
jgi:chorismate mutase/GNAT superfamily N-acetyltransferase